MCFADWVLLELDRNLSSDLGAREVSPACVFDFHQILKRALMVRVYWVFDAGAPRFVVVLVLPEALYLRGLAPY